MSSALHINHRWRQVTVNVKARLPAPDASLGRTYFETPSDKPLQFTMGAHLRSLMLCN